jgi:hypothetical protein
MSTEGGKALPTSIHVTLDDVDAQSTHHMERNRAIITVTSDTILQAGGELNIAIAVPFALSKKLPT